MSSDEQFWYGIWRTIILCFTLLMCGLLFYYTHKNQQMTDMVMKGADPIKVMCAFDGTGTHDRVMCAGYLKNGN